MPLGTDNDELYEAVGAAAEKFSREEGLGAVNDMSLRQYLTSPSIAKNRNFFILVGTCACWFLLDIAFYSQNLFLPDVLKRTGFSKPIKLPEGYTGLPNSDITCTGECSRAVYNSIYRSAVGNALGEFVAFGWCFFFCCCGGGGGRVSLVIFFFFLSPSFLTSGLLSLTKHAKQSPSSAPSPGTGSRSRSSTSGAEFLFFCFCFAFVVEGLSVVAGR